MIEKSLLIFISFNEIVIILFLFVILFIFVTYRRKVKRRK